MAEQRKRKKDNTNKSKTFFYSDVEYFTANLSSVIEPFYVQRY